MSLRPIGVAFRVSRLELGGVEFTAIGPRGFRMHGFRTEWALSDREGSLAVRRLDLAELRTLNIQILTLQTLYPKT